MDASIPPSEVNAKAVLNASPRHGEMIDVAYTGGGGTTPIRTWIVYPERKEKAGVVIVIHEIYGLSDWIRSVADQFAKEGFIAVAPDLISGLAPGGGGTEAAGSRDDVVQLVRTLTPGEARARIDAVREYAMRLPSANGKFATVGFCWGGARSFEYAATRPAPAASIVYYGMSPDSATLAQVVAPVQGHYGGEDARVVVTIDPARAVMQKLGEAYEPHVYPGAGHGFLRVQQGPDVNNPKAPDNSAQHERNGANLKAAREAWPLTIAYLRKVLE